MNEWVAVWPSDNGSSHVDKARLRRPRLVLRVWDAWPFTGIQPRYVTNHLADSASCLIANGNKYWSRDSGSGLRWEGNHRSGFASAERHTICYIHLQAERPKKGRWAPHLHCRKVYSTLLFLLYSQRSYSLKIDFSAHSFSERFTENRILLLYFQWFHSLKIDSSAQSFSETFTENSFYEYSCHTELSFWT